MAKAATMLANSFATHPGNNVPESQDIRGGVLARSTSKKAQKKEKTASFYREVTDAVNSKVANFMIGFEELDDEEESEIVKLRQSVEELRGNYRGLRMELDVAREAVQSYASVVEALEGSLRDVAGKAEGMRNFKEEVDETHKQFVVQLESSLNGALASLHGRIVASDQGHAAFRDEVQQNFNRVQEELEGSVSEALMVAKARLDQTNTRLDSCERHNDLTNISQEFGQYREHVDGVIHTLAQNMANELKYTRDDIEQVHGLMLIVQQAWGMKTKALRNKRQQDNLRQPVSLLPAEFLTH
mmetsp:Transcript_37502/g.74417  ORF Transcript_37502/g.74417 Transcript_37502/m.74417 type:complete len:300 (+) Transcript_37502:68-967(+)